MAYDIIELTRTGSFATGMTEGTDYIIGTLQGDFAEGQRGIWLPVAASTEEEA